MRTDPVCESPSQFDLSLLPSFPLESLPWMDCRWPCIPSALVAANPLLWSWRPRAGPSQTAARWLVSSLLYSCRYYTDPSGTFWQCNAKAIGSGSEGADSSLQEQYNKVRSPLFFHGKLLKSPEKWALFLPGPAVVYRFKGNGQIGFFYNFIIFLNAGIEP